MSKHSLTTRRRVVKLAGASAAMALLAGCPDDDEAPEEPEDDENDVENGIEIEPDTRIVFFAETAGWEGVEPSEIEDEVNPTLVLEEGEDYEIGWEEGDGSEHNIEIWDEDDNVVDDLETEWVAEPDDDDQFLEFTASEEMASYVCEPHATTMVGDLQVE